MSQGLTKTKRRIQSVTSTMKITKAMNLVATVKLKKWKDSMENIQVYLDSMKDIISSCSSSFDPFETDRTPYKIYKEATKNLYVVVTSSLGLCGGYNYNLFKFLNERLEKGDVALVMGTKGLVKLSHNDEIDVKDDYVGFLDRFNYQVVSVLREKLLKEYETGQYKKVSLISTHYKNSLTFIPEETQIFPLSSEPTDIRKFNDIIYEPNEREVLDLLTPKYLDTTLYAKLTESMVSEQASRRNAMDTATNNAEDLVDKLQIEYNKARQGAITQEITEVVAGASK